ncbi:MAG: beta-propeller domain-containing protein [Eubacterium sp.]|nr:beta-propeller domain-containing protein [Eubacterium sp.]
MKNNKDFDFIKNEFEKENITAPDTLSEDAARDMLEGKEQKKIRLYQTRTFKSIVSAAACIAIVITALAVSRPYFVTKENVVDTDSSQQVLNSFASINDVKSAVKKIERQNMDHYFYFDKGAMVDEVAEDMAVTSSAAGSTSYAQTYKQVDAVDEGDIIKNDGRYIYSLDSRLNKIRIYNSDAEFVSLIEDFKHDYSNILGDEYIVDMYVYKDFLVVNTNKSVYENDDYENSVGTYIYDISDISKPNEISSFSQSGYYTSSRMIGSQLYVVSNDYIYSNQCKDDSDYIPYVCEGKNGEKEPLKLDDICYAVNPSTASYLVVSSIDIETGKKSSDTKALFGAGADIYCNENNMYVCMNEANGLIDSLSYAPTETKLCIVKIKLDKNDIQFTATGEVVGNTNDQFSMDEKDGNLRIATTSYDKDGEEINNLFVLNENLEKIGEVTGFAKTESIKAVRFIGDMAYVITYEQTDPLFVIDLSNPESPQIKGEVEITGFSSLLVPIDENTLLGIGFSTEDGFDMEITNGLKLALFDISNPEKPQVLDSIAMKNTDSDAQYNHHALVVNTDKGYYAIPYNNHDNLRKGAITFKIQDGKIVITNDFIASSPDYENISRCTYIDDTMYLLSDSANIYIFNVK